MRGPHITSCGDIHAICANHQTDRRFAVISGNQRGTFQCLNQLAFVDNHLCFIVLGEGLCITDEIPLNQAGNHNSRP